MPQVKDQIFVKSALFSTSQADNRKTIIGTWNFHQRVPREVSVVVFPNFRGYNVLSDHVVVPRQHAYRPSHSTEEAVLGVAQRLTSNTDAGPI